MGEPLSYRVWIAEEPDKVGIVLEAEEGTGQERIVDARNFVPNRGLWVPIMWVCRTIISDYGLIAKAPF